MLAETNNYADRAVDWLAETWNDSVAMRDDGPAVRGFCWYSLTDQVDWDTCMREANDRVNSSASWTWIGFAVPSVTPTRHSPDRPRPASPSRWLGLPRRPPEP